MTRRYSQVLGGALALGLAFSAACSSEGAPKSSPAPAAPAAPQAAAAPATPPPAPAVQAPTLPPAVAPARSLAASNAAALRGLHTSPEKGPVGTPFTLKGEGLPPNAAVELQWATWDGSYAMKPSAETVAYESRKLTDARTLLGRVTTGADGTFAAAYAAPEDFGEQHEIYAVVDGEEVARGGFRIELAASISPSEGPIGTPVTVTVTGLAAKLFSGATLAMRYDNAYTGVMTATTTHGTARADLRAAGAPGTHVVQINAGSLPAYLNIAQSPYAFVYEDLPTKEDFRLAFRVTADNGAPANTIAWPEAERVQRQPAGAPLTTVSGAKTVGVTAALAPQSGPILSKPVLTAEGLTPGQPVDAYWMTARGNRVTASGWSLAEIPLGTVSADANGRVSGPVEVPDDLGGWHVLKLAQNGQIVAEAPYFVERSLVSVSKRQVKTGEAISITIKGVGWTELDNGFAMTYDNAFVGYACGFNSNGDVTMEVVATGGKGTHLIDLYPMLYAGKDAKWWYWTPVLTYARDFPALALGYRLPAFRLAIDVTE